MHRCHRKRITDAICQAKEITLVGWEKIHIMAESEKKIDKQKKRILFVANVAKEHMRKFHIPTITMLKNEGWIVDVACSMDAEIIECDFCWDMKYKRNPISVKTIQGVKQLKEIMQAVSYDIVYCHTPTGSIVARLAMIGTKKKPIVIYLAHGFHFYKGASLINWSLFYPVERFLARWTDYLITINQEDYNLAKRKHMYRKAVFKIPGMGVNFERLKDSKGNARSRIRQEFGINKDDFVLIYIAELIPNKNQGKLIDVLKILSKKYSNIKLLLVGPDHNEGFFQKYAEEQHISNKVIFTGWRSDVGDLLHASDVCVASSIREGFGLNLVESMACGLPVVAFENRGHREIVKNKENGYLIKQNAVAKMAKYIEKIMRGNYQAFSSRAKKMSLQYDEKKVSKKIVRIIDGIYQKEIYR